jgi:uncharacterized protein with von Willebrand factor type A (vWA) domain
MPRGVKKVVPEPKKAEVSEMTEVSELVRLTEVALAKKPRAKKMKEEAPKAVETGTVTISKEEYALLKSYEASHLAKVAQRKARREARKATKPTKAMLEAKLKEMEALLKSKEPTPTSSSEEEGEEEKEESSAEQSEVEEEDEKEASEEEAEETTE